MDTMQKIHIAWAKAHCPQRKAPDQCNKWRGDAPYVDAVSSVEPHTVLRNTRPLAQTDLLDPELEAAYSEAFRVWIAPPVHTQFQLRDSAAATWRQTRPDISSREHSQKWRDKFIRLAFEVLHRVLVTDPGRVQNGRMADDEAKHVDQILAWARQATETTPEKLPLANPLRVECVQIASQWRSRLVSRARKLGLSREDAEDVAGEAILNYLNSSPSDDVPLLWKQLDYSVRRLQRNRTRQRKLAEKVMVLHSGETGRDPHDAARPVTRLSRDAEHIVEAILSSDTDTYSEAFFIAALARSDEQFGALPDSERHARLDAALAELRTQLGGGADA